mmetsp:Transcript_40499/g.105028  ORF Transcript_40499/g.105028 Transcript_40499/m.105028 type:complete len:197 (+) Transcript_40499:2323-2913(+)
METKNVQNRQRFPRKGERFGLSVPPPLIENIPRKEDAEGEGTLIAKTERFSFKEVLAPCLGFPSASLLCLFRPFLVSVPFFLLTFEGVENGEQRHAGPPLPPKWGTPTRSCDFPRDPGETGGRHQKPPCKTVGGRRWVVDRVVGASARTRRRDRVPFRVKDSGLGPEQMFLVLSCLSRSDFRASFCVGGKRSEERR